MRRRSFRSVASALCCTALLCTLLAAPARGSSVRRIRFSGFTWTVKASTGKVGPGPNFFSASTRNVWVDANGELHLRIMRSNGRWSVAEVINSATLGYGTYTWVLDSRVDRLDANAVLGMFTWNDTDPRFANREIDIEASRWGVPSDPTNAQYVVQPAATRGHLRRTTQGPRVPATFSFTWTATSLSWRAPGASPSSYRYAGNDRPPAGGAHPHVNLWLVGGHAPRGRLPVEVVIRSFKFAPA